MKVRARTQPDGSIIFPVKGSPPPEFPGFVRDTKNPFRFIPKFPECRHHHIETKINKKCQCTVTIHTCNVLNLPVCPNFCDNCKIRIDGVKITRLEKILTYDEIKKVPREVWIFGKGPSLDTYSFDKAGDFRVGINEAVYRVPRCKVACAGDLATLDKFIANVPRVDWFHYPSYITEHDIQPSFRYSELGLATAPAIIKTLALWGTRKFHMVGFDGIFAGVWEYAKSLKLEDPVGGQYDYQRGVIEKLKEEFGLTYITP